MRPLAIVLLLGAACSPSSQNPYSCATCHQTDATADPDRIDSGYNLHGVAARESYWGGHHLTLASAIDECRMNFMRAIDPLDPADNDSRAMYAFLASITPEGSPTAPLPFTVIENIEGYPSGNDANGEVIYRNTCERCHGEAHTGDGKIDERAYTLPEYALASYPMIFPDFPPGEVVIEKIRHGGYFNTIGVMPLYSAEALSDGQIADLLAFLNLPATR